MAVFQDLSHSTPPEDLDELRHLAQEAPDCTQASDEEEAEAIEVGSWTGRTALVLYEYFARVYCLDHFKGSPGERERLGLLARQLGSDVIRKAFCENMGSSLFSGIYPVIGPSLTWAALWPRKVSLVFLDARHDNEDIRADIVAWSPHLVSRGVLCGHDYGVFPGVTRAVNELIPREDLHVVGTAWSTRAR